MNSVDFLFENVCTMMISTRSVQYHTTVVLYTTLQYTTYEIS